MDPAGVVSIGTACCKPSPQKILRSLRAFSLPVSVLPVFLAVAVAVPPRQWDWLVLLVSAAGAGLLHLGGNLLNDYFDFLSGVDRPLHDDAGRPGRLLVTGQLKPRTILAEAIVCLAMAGTIAVYLAWRVGLGILAFQGAALVMLYSYTGPPLRLKYRAMGETVIFVVFGPLLMMGAAWAQTQRLEVGVLLMSLPVGLATTAVLVGNNYRDREEDAQAGIRTLGRIAAGRLARVLYAVFVIGATLLPAAWAATGLAPVGLLLAPAALLLLAKPLAAMRRDQRLADIDVQTARFTALLLLMMWGAYVAHWLATAQ